MSSNVEGDKPKVITTRRSSLKCRQLVNKLDPDAIMKAKPKGKRNSVSWGLSNTFEFKAMKATFQDSKDINKEDNSEQKEKHDKFLATRKASIKNESSLLKEMLKKNAASIIEEENDDEAKANMKKNLQMGKDALKEVSESSESSKSKNSSKSGSKSGSKSSSRSNSRSDSKSSSKSGSRSSSRSKSKSYSKSSSRHKNKSGKEKVKKSDKESENDTNKETEKIDIKKKRKVQMAEKTKEESDKDSQNNKETEKISIKKNRKIKIAEKEDENENDKDSEKILKKNRKVKMEEEEDDKGNDKDSEKINIRKNRKIKISDDINEDNFEEKKAEVIDSIKENDTKVRLISLNEANSLNLDKIAYITLTDGTVAILKKVEEGNIEENPKINNKRLNLSNKPQINQNNMYEEGYNFQNNIYNDPNIPEQEVYYDNDNDNDNNNVYNEPLGIGSAYNNNYEPQNINYYPNRPIPNINIIPDNQIPINVPYEASISIPRIIPNNIINIPQHYDINRSQYQINSHEPYETNLSYASGLINNRRAISPLYYTNQNRQNRQYIKNYNQQFTPSQNIRQNLSPNYKINYQNYQKYSKNIYPSNNKYQNRSQNNLSNSNIPQIINLTQTQIPKEPNKFKVKVLEVIPVKLCDNNNINRNKSDNSSQLVYPFFNTQVMDPDLSPRNNQSHFQPQQRRLFNYSQASTINNNTNENRINSFEQELNILNKQMTDSFNDFDNLEEEQEDYQNDELYKNCDLKYSELSLGQSGGKLKSKNMRRQNYMRPFTKPQINKKNVASESRYVKDKPNVYNNQNIKESKGNSLKRK